MDCPGYTQNRIVGSYLDYNDLVAVDPEHLLVSSGFFLGGGALRLKASKAGRGVINGLVVRDSEFDYSSDGPAIKLDESEARFSALIDTVIDGNMLDSTYHSLTTRVTRRFQFVTVAAPASYCFDLRDSLLFPQFNATSVQVTLHTADASVAPSVVVVPGRAKGVPEDDQRSVCVATSTVTVGTPLTVDLSVDQSRYTFGHAAAAVSTATRTPFRTAAYRV